MLGHVTKIMHWSKYTVATSQLTLRWMCDSPRKGCARRITSIYSYMWHEQAIAEWSRQVISIIACCHSVKLCALAAQGFRWCSAQNVKIMPDAAFTKRMCDRWGLLWKGDVVATSRVTLCWMCDSPRTVRAWRIKPMYMWREQAIIKWSHWVISIVACCHNVKLCARVARAFQSQQGYHPCHLINSTNRVCLMAKLLQQCFCLWWQNKYCHVKFWKCQKAVSVLPHEAK